MTNLIEKLKAAEVGSRELDIAIWEMFSTPKIEGDLNRIKGTWPRGCSDQEKADRRRSFLTANAPRFTGSLDAALALAERVVGSDEWVIVRSDEDGFTTYHAAVKPKVLSEAKTPALAMCLAILQASTRGENEEEAGHD